MSEIPKITILYEEDDIAAIEKPAGVLVHADRETANAPEYTVADWVLQHYPSAAEAGEPMTLPDGTVLPRPGIVHRLDRDTSGVMLICKTKEAYAFYKKAFHDRKIKKEYHALVYDPFNEDRGEIKRPIGRSATDFRQYSAQRGARGEMRDAITRFIVKEKTREASFVHAFPLTGRTHQIRVHMKAIHHPIICDPLYASGRPCLFGIGRLALHAYRLSWTGRDGREREAIAPYPSDFAAALAEFRKSQQK